MAPASKLATVKPKAANERICPRIALPWRSNWVIVICVPSAMLGLTVSFINKKPNITTICTRELAKMIKDSAKPPR